MEDVQAHPTASSTDEETRTVLLARSGLLDPDPDPELDHWTSVLRRATGASVVAVCVETPERTLVKGLWTGSAATPQTAEIPAGESVERFLTANIPHAGKARQPAPTYLEGSVIVDGHVLCKIGLADTAPREWTERDLQTLENAASAVAVQIRLRLANHDALRFHELVGSHNRVHELIARGAPLREVLVELVEGIERHDPSVIACVVLLDREAGALRPGAAPSLPPHYFAAIDGVVIGPNVGTCGSAAWSGQLTITEDIAEDPKWAPIRDFAVGAGLRHCWSMPIKSTTGEVLGTLALYGPRPRLPLPEHLTLIADGARLAGIAIERHRALEQLIHDARHDGLSGLPNRTAIFESLDEAIVRLEPESSVAVLFVDLDGLKTLNDTLGHDRADEMIREVGQRLSNAVRSTDFVGRFGGDEFIVVAEEVANEEEASKLGFRLLEAISQPLPWVESTVVTASIGIALIAGPGADAREAIRQADGAMYEAKRAGGDRIVFFRGSRRAHEGRRLALGRELRGAETRGELAIAFQPVFELETGEITAVEALLRWNHPTLGAVSPAEFVPVAEDTGSIVPIGAWVLRESCETIRRISEVAGRPIELAVNVSGRQIAHPGFAQTVQKTLSHAQFPTAQLTLEITETALIRADAVIARTLRELEAHGVRIVLDDFGTGFSSLSWLKEHPLNAIKIDRGFVSGLAEDFRDQAIVSSLVGMSRALGCTVTAEGVETEEQLEALRALDCERVQGFLLARPMPASELEALLSSPNVVSIQQTAATTGPADPRRTARTRHHHERVPGPSRRPVALRLPSGM
jgi:diguanylate cyclase (GGDEF)-like protein